jgi:hypothetical protein
MKAERKLIRMRFQAGLEHFARFSCLPCFAAIRKLNYRGTVRRRIVQKDSASIFLLVAQPFGVVTDNDDHRVVVLFFLSEY